MTNPSKTETVIVRMSPADKKKCRQKAKKDKRNLSDWARLKLLE